MNHHPRHLLVDDFNHPVRFSIMAALAGVERVSFAVLRDYLEVSDSVLSKQTSLLESAKMVKIDKGYSEKRPRTWFSLTSYGRKAWNEHLSALKEIAETHVNPNE